MTEQTKNHTICILRKGSVLSNENFYKSSIWITIIVDLAEHSGKDPVKLKDISRVKTYPSITVRQLISCPWNRNNNSFEASVETVVVIS
jgi:hypothetical protein